MDDLPQTESSGQPGVPKRSLITRLTNVFVSPGEVFDEVKAGPPVTANWLAPLAITIVVASLSVIIAFSQPAVLQNVKEIRERVVQSNVASGKMTQKDADERLAKLEGVLTPSTLTALGIGGTVLIRVIDLFFVALVLYVIGRVDLRGNVRYMQALEVTGLSMLIMALGLTVTTLLIVIQGKVTAAPNLAVLIPNFDPANPVHVVLSAVNVFGLWQTAVLSIGLARLNGVSLVRAAPWLFGLWAILKFWPVLRSLST